MTLIIIGCKTNKQADLIVHNAKIYTVDKNFSVNQAMAVKDGQILELGGNNQILNNYNATEVIDVNQAIIYPGFIDGHCHFFSYGVGLLKRADLKNTASFEEVIEVLKKHHQKHSSYWIEGRGWDQNDWEVKEFPAKELLDKVFPEHPVLLTRIDGHAALANSVALEIAGIKKDTKTQGGDIIIRDGEPTGLLIDEAIELVSDHIPDLSRRQMIDAFEIAQKNCFGVGLTSVVDAGLSHDTIYLIDSLQTAGELKIRINCMLKSSQENLDMFFKVGPIYKDRLQVNSIKLFADGALGSRGAAMLEEYSDDPGNNGLIIYPIEHYQNVCQQAYANGFQVNTHAIGDSGNRMILDVYSKILKGTNDRRWRVEHCQVLHPEDFDKFGKYNIIPSVQATHCTSDMYWADERVGKDRIKGAYAYQDLLDQNGWIINGTDFPIEKIDPLLTFYASVSRKDLNNYPEGGFQTENGLSREDALRSMTIWAARGSFQEDELGSLKAGKKADFVILDRDIMVIPEQEIPAVKVLGTFVGGEKVY